MKIVVFTYNRYDSITTSAVIEEAGIAHDVLCHSGESRQAFIDAGRVKPERIISTGAPKGLANNRNWYIENMLAENEWCLMLVDDWRRCTELDDYDSETREELPIELGKSSTEWSRKFRKLIDFKQFYRRAEELVLKCEDRGVLLGGFAGYTNSLFRSTHWKRDVLADGRAWVMKKSKLRFDTNAQMVDDVCFCAINIMNETGVLVNSWVLPECARYTKGSFGSIQDRMPQKIKECEYLVNTYPCIKYAPKTGWPERSHVRLMPRTQAAKVIRETKEQQRLF